MKRADSLPRAIVSAQPTARDAVDGWNEVKAASDRIDAQRAAEAGSGLDAPAKLFPMPGTRWRWTGDHVAPPGDWHIVTGLRWFRGRVEAMFGASRCAGVEHMMTRPEWVCDVDAAASLAPEKPAAPDVAELQARAWAIHGDMATHTLGEQRDAKPEAPPVELRDRTRFETQGARATLVAVGTNWRPRWDMFGTGPLYTSADVLGFFASGAWRLLPDEPRPEAPAKPRVPGIPGHDSASALGCCGRVDCPHLDPVDASDEPRPEAAPEPVVKDPYVAHQDLVTGETLYVPKQPEAPAPGRKRVTLVAFPTPLALDSMARDVGLDHDRRAMLMIYCDRFKVDLDVAPDGSAEPVAVDGKPVGDADSLVALGAIADGLRSSAPCPPHGSLACRALERVEALHCQIDVLKSERRRLEEEVRAARAGEEAWRMMSVARGQLCKDRVNDLYEAGRRVIAAERAMLDLGLDPETGKPLAKGGS